MTECAARGHERRPRVGPVREEQHQRPVRQLIDHMAQEIHRGRIGPVEILDEDEQRLLLEAPLDQGARRPARSGAGAARARRRVGLRLLQPEHVAQHRRDGLGLLVPRAERPEAGGQLLPGDVQRVRRVHPIGLAEERAEDAVGRLAQGRARRAAHRGAGEPPVGVEPRAGARR